MVDVICGYIFNVSSWGLNHMDYHIDVALTFVCPFQAVGLGTTVIWWNSKVSSMPSWTITWSLERFKQKKRNSILCHNVLYSISFMCLIHIISEFIFLYKFIWTDFKGQVLKPSVFAGAIYFLLMSVYPLLLTNKENFSV